MPRSLHACRICGESEALAHNHQLHLCITGCSRLYHAIIPILLCACRAFKGLAYKRYQHVPIYLEWAPANIFSPDAPKLQPGTQATPSTAVTTAVDGTAPPATGAAPDVDRASVAVLPDIEDAETSTIYVKNLAFATGINSVDNRCV